MMQEIDIAYFYEHTARELDVACAVTSIVRREHGLRTEIVHWPHGYHLISGKMKPRVLVLPFCYAEESFVLCLLDNRDALYFNLSWEQLFYKGNRIAKAPRRDFALNHVVHHAWSELYAGFLKQCGIPEGHIFPNGNPAYALYDEPYRKYFTSREALASRYGLDPGKRWIFFPENYNWAFYSEATLDAFIRKGQSREDVLTLREFCKKSLSEVITWCVEAASSDAEIILRPRPATPVGDFKASILPIIRNIPDRLHLIQEESVREWILASDIVVSSHSTSLIEASVAKKQVYMLEPYPMPSALFSEWQCLVPKIRGRREFLDICSGLVDNERDSRLETWARNTMMSNGDSIRNIADFLAGLCRDAKQPATISRKSATPPFPLPFPAWLLYELRRLVWLQKRRNPSKMIEPEFVKDALEHEYIEKRVEDWGRISL